MLGRNRKLLLSAQQALRHEELPAVILQRKDEFISTPFVWLHAVLRLANDRHDRKSLEAVSGSFSQLTQVDVDPEAVIAQTQASNLGYLQHWIRYLQSSGRSSADILGKGETSGLLVHLPLTGLKSYSMPNRLIAIGR